MLAFGVSYSFAYTKCLSIDFLGAIALGFIKLINLVLNHPKPYRINLSNFLWGWGASIFSYRYEYLWVGGRVFEYSIAYLNYNNSQLNAL